MVLVVVVQTLTVVVLAVLSLQALVAEAVAVTLTGHGLILVAVLEDTLVAVEKTLVLELVKKVTVAVEVLVLSTPQLGV
jgi:hypothetical protein